MAYERQQCQLENFVREVLAESDDEEEIGGIASEEEDGVEIQEENSDSEQSADEDGDLEDYNYEQIRFYIGKDTETLWMNQLPPQAVRIRARNIIPAIHAPGVRQAGKNALTPIDSWSLFFSDEILEKIVEYTNIKIQQLQVGYNRERNAKETNLLEIKAVIGLLYLAGVKKSSHVNLKDLWATDGLGLDLMRCVMSLSRFEFLLSALRFDDVLTRNQRKHLDRLAPVREMFEYVVENFKKYYSPGHTMTLDEKLEGFRGRCPFKQFIKNKPAKYGLKVFALVDAKMIYTVNLEIYAGNQPEGPFKVSNSAKDVTMRMIKPIENSGRNLTTDNWYTSVPLALELLGKRLTLVGTLRKNKREIPPEFLAKKAENTSLFAFDDNNTTLVSYSPKKNKNVILLSTMHNAPEIDNSTGTQRKPVIITWYNDTKCGVDTLDQLSSLYSVSRKTRRWPMVIFFSLLNTVGVNAQVIVASNQHFERKIVRRRFLQELGISLVSPHMKTRVLMMNLPKELRCSIKKYLPTAEELAGPRERPARGRCTVCPRSRDRKTPFSCETCYKLVCKEHMKVVCEDCL